MYNAFISYSHKDEIVAAAVDSGLRRFARSWLGIRALRPFRYTASMAAAPELWPAIQDVMRESEYLVLLASPASAASPLVPREINEWLDSGRADRLLIVLVAGSIVWDSDAADFDWTRTDAIPKQCAGRFAGVPIYVDLTGIGPGQLVLGNPQFKDAIATIASTIHGRPKDELIGQDVRQRRVRDTAIGVAVAVVLALSVAAVWQAIEAMRQRDEALRSLSQSLAAEARRFWASNQRERAVAFLAQAVRVNPEDREKATQLISWLTHHPWPQRPRIIHNPGLNDSVDVRGGKVLVVRDGTTVSAALDDVKGDAPSTGGPLIKEAEWVGPYIAVATDAGAIEVWKDGTRVAGCVVGWQPGNPWAVSPDAQHFAVVVQDRLAIRALATCSEIATAVTVEDGETLEFSSDSSHLLVSTSYDSSVVKVSSGKQVANESLMALNLIQRRGATGTELLAGEIQGTKLTKYFAALWHSNGRISEPTEVTHYSADDPSDDGGQHLVVHMAVASTGDTLFSLCADGALETRRIDKRGRIGRSVTSRRQLEHLPPAAGIYLATFR